MLKIIHHPAEILKERMPEFDFSNPSEDPVQLEKDMIETMFASGGIGLSANQVGKRVRMFVMGNKADPESAQGFFNPHIIATTERLSELGLLTDSKNQILAFVLLKFPLGDE